MIVALSCRNIPISQKKNILAAAGQRGKEKSTCPSEIAGKGIDLAMLRPYLPAGEPHSQEDHKSELYAYGRMLKPHASSCQKLMPGIPRLDYPTSKRGVPILNNFVSFLESRFVKSILSLIKR